MVQYPFLSLLRCSLPSVMCDELPPSCTPGRHEKKPVWVGSQWFDGRTTSGCYIATIIGLQYNGANVLKRTSFQCMVNLKFTGRVDVILGGLDVVAIINSIVAVNLRYKPLLAMRATLPLSSR